MVKVSGIAYRANRKCVVATCIVPKGAVKIVAELYSEKGYKIELEEI